MVEEFVKSNRIDLEGSLVPEDVVFLMRHLEKHDQPREFLLYIDTPAGREWYRFEHVPTGADLDFLVRRKMNVWLGEARALPDEDPDLVEQEVERGREDPAG